MALVFKFDSDNSMTVSPFKVEINSSKGLIIVANLPFIKEVKRAMLKALDGEHLNFSFYKDIAA